MLHPSVEAIDTARLSGAYPDPFGTPDGAEARRRAWAIRRALYPSPEIPVAASEDAVIPGRSGAIPVRIIRPLGEVASGTVVYFHGGGWIVGDLDSHQAHAARIANRAGCVVVNVDYRMAPEHRFPAAAEDAIDALDWAAANIARLGGDGARLAVAGDSAGGNLAAVAAIHARDAGLPLAAQLLIYPAPDFRSRVRNPRMVEKLYLGEDCVALAEDWKASPIVADLTGVAPAIIGVGVHDYLYADNVAFVARLRASGVPVTFREYPDLNHSFFSYAGVSAPCAAASDQLCDDLRARLHG